MSTKALGKVVLLMREDKYPALHTEAFAELEAIRRAAKVLTGCDMDLFPRGTLTPEDAQGAMDVLLAIAKEGS